jgi:hypothetical protein
LFGGGVNDVSPTFYNVIDYITIASTGNAIDFGDLLNTSYNNAACSSTTRGVFALGNSGGSVNVMQYVTIASTGNATDFGDLLFSMTDMAGLSNCHGGL